MKLLASLALSSSYLFMGADAQLSFVDPVTATGDYTTLLSLISDPSISETISGAGNITVFGPNDAAFAAISDVVAGLSEDEVNAILANHVVPGLYTPAMVEEAGCVMLQPLMGAPIRAMWVAADTSMTIGGGRKLAHGTVMINDAAVVAVDVGGGRRLAGHAMASESIFHGLDKVIMPGDFSCPDMEPDMGAPSFLEAVAATGDYDTLFSLIDGDEMLQGAIASAGPITVFGPKDEAFAAIADAVAGLSVEEVRATLGNHVVSGVYTAAMVEEAGCVMLQPLMGEPIRAMWVPKDTTMTMGGGRRLAHGTVVINDAAVVAVDVGGGRRLAGHAMANETSIFHGLDKVIMPGDFACPDMGTAAPIAAPTAGKTMESSASFSGFSAVLTAVVALFNYGF